MFRNLFCIVLFTLIRGKSSELHSNEELPRYEGFDEKEYLLAFDRFESFMQTYNKTYEEGNEKARRFNIFQDNLRRIEAIQRDDQGTAVYGVTKFADLTYEEFTERYTTGRLSPTEESGFLTPESTVIDDRKKFNSTFQEYKPFDWTRTTYPGKVHKQDKCNSCYAFAPVSMLEFLLSKERNQQIFLSAQFIIDCSRACCGNKGCESGRVVGTMTTLKTYGTPLESTYPYEDKENPCKIPDLKAARGMYKLAGGHKILDGEDRMMEILPISPIVVSINPATLQFYNGGLSSPTAVECPQYEEKRVHALLIVGNGSENGKEFFKLQNTYGTDWGERGFIRFEAFKNACGLEEEPYYGSLKRK